MTTALVIACYLLVMLFVYSLCRAAHDADELMETMREEQRTREQG